MGHWAERSVPENATAHTTPSRFTAVAHMWLLRPLASADTAAVRAALSCAWLGRPAQAPSAARAVPTAVRTNGPASAILAA